MSIQTTDTVHCTAHACTAATFGATTKHGHKETPAARARRARANADNAGWRCTKTGDWCPDHADQADDGGAGDA